MKNKWMIVPYSITHFLVDLGCALFMYHYGVQSKDLLLLILLYNFCAFALQMPFGLIVDYVNRNAVFAAVGCMLVGISFFVKSFLLVAVIILGIGNALFHVGAGTDVLNSSTKKASLLGVFVSPGAFGIFFGTMYGGRDLMLFGFYPFVLLLVGVLILILDYLPEKSFKSHNVSVSFDSAMNPSAWVAIFCFFAVVAVRSYLGMVKFTWSKEGAWAYFLICAVVFGKMLGGVLGDKFGIKRVMAVSLVVSIVCFAFSNVPVMGVIAILSFNMTMPITLWAVAKVLKNARGFSFGLLTVALFLGYLPSYFAKETMYHVPIVTAVITIISLGVLTVGLSKVVEE